MISNDTDLQNSIEELQEDITIYTVDLSDIMSSEDINYTNQSIYDLLNTLYERIRILEDTKNYIKANVIKTIDDKKKSFEQILADIEKNNDIYSDDKKNGTVAPYSWSTDNIQDRDGTALSPLNYTESLLYPKGNNAYEANISSIVHESPDIPFYININASERYYEAIYLKKHADTISDSIVISFLEPKLINYVSVEEYNVKNSIVEYTKPDGSTGTVFANRYFEPVMISSIRLYLLATEYKIVDKNIDKEKLVSDAFSDFSTESAELQETESDTANILQNKIYDSESKTYIEKVATS